MKQYLTNSFKNLMLVVSAILVSYGLSRAQSPYCSATTTNNPCAYPMAIGTLNIKAAGSFSIYVNTTNCGGPYNLYGSTSAPAVSLTGGTPYTFEITQTPSGPYALHVGLWIDLNGDNDYTDANEYVGGTSGALNNWTDLSTGTSPQGRSFTMPTVTSQIVTRMRLRVDYSGSAAFTNNSYACTTLSYGETEEYVIALVPPSTPQANFTSPTTAFVNTQVDFINQNQIGYFGHWWDRDDDGTIESTSVNYSYTWNTTGTYAVRLTSQNGLGRDSIAKNITIVNPTAAPAADFVSNKNTFSQYELMQLYDLSTNGATSWNWIVWDPIDSLGTVMTTSGTNPSIHRNPMFSMMIPGTYNVCMRAGNIIGTSAWMCKSAYVKTNAPTEYNIGPVIPNMPADGVLYDNGGNANNYGNNRYDFLTIAPCGATKITMKFTTFKLGAGDNLQLYDGVNAAGAPLHPSGGWTSANPAPRFTDIVANSGAVYVLFQTDGATVDSGFRMEWKSTLGPLTPPNVSYTDPGLVYNSVPVTIFNTSTGAKGDVSYVWEIDGAMVGTSKDFPFTWLTDGTYELKLTVTTCAGSSSYSDSITVETPHTKTNLDFFAYNRRPAAGDTVMFTTTSDKANQWRWTVYPNTIQYAAGSATSKNITLRFMQSGAYTVTLRAWNSLDSPGTVKTLIKDDYVVVTNYCKPAAPIVIEDVGISQVTLKKGSTVLLDNTTTAGATGVPYSDYSKSKTATLTFGATYDISLSRKTNINNATRMVWIDFNVDGDFNDAGELIVNESAGTAMNYNGTFTVPDITTSFVGKTLMRVSIAYSASTNNPCGSNGNGIPNASTYIGEFEDYGIVLVNDNMAPSLTLNGDDTMSIEIGTTFTDPEATATDPTEGDISYKIMKVSDVDETNAGIYVITYSVVDASGNPAPTRTRIVYVVADKTPPTLALNGADTVEIDVKIGVYTEMMGSANDAKDGDLSSAIIVTGTVNTDVIGTYVLTYTVADAQGNKVSKTRVVRVVDDSIPFIDPKGSDNIQIGSAFFDQTIALDNYDLDINNKLQKTGATVNPQVPGIYTITYTVEDQSGNQAIPVVRNYRVDDFTLPEIGFDESDTQVIAVNPVTPYKVENPPLSDAYYASELVHLEVVSNVNAYQLGLYTVVFTATDPSGNVSTKTRYVRVVDRIAPIIRANILHIKQNANYNPMAGLIIQDNYYSPTTLLPLVKIIDYTVDIYNAGIYDITYRVTDPSGNVSLPFTRTVVVSADGPAMGVKEVVNGSFIAYPNPSTGLVNVEFTTTPTQNAHIQVMDITGKVILDQEVTAAASNKVSLDLSSFATGMYFIKYIDQDKQVTEKIQIVK